MHVITYQINVMCIILQTNESIISKSFNLTMTRWWNIHLGYTHFEGCIPKLFECCLTSRGQYYNYIRVGAVVIQFESRLWQCVLDTTVPSQGHYGFHSFPLLTDFVCLYNYEFRLSLCKIYRSSVILLLPVFSQWLVASRWFSRLSIGTSIKDVYFVLCYLNQ
jgi:hypothetical protein